MWKHVSHPNTTPFYGLVNGFNGRSGIGMICKWMPNGHVIEFLQHHGNANRLSLVNALANITLVPYTNHGYRYQ